MKMDEIMDDHILETAHTMKTDENHWQNDGTTAISKLANNDCETWIKSENRMTMGVFTPRPKPPVKPRTSSKASQEPLPDG